MLDVRGTIPYLTAHLKQGSCHRDLALHWGEETSCVACAPHSLQSDRVA